MLASAQLSFSFGPQEVSAPVRQPGPPSILEVIRRRLVAIHGRQQIGDRLDPVDQLMSGIIGARTREDIAFPTFKRLQYRYKTWAAVSRASCDDIERIIRPVVDAGRKAEQIPRALSLIAQRTGSLDLMFLKHWTTQAATAWLMALPGTGPKIAATTLNWSVLRQRVLPVDIHLSRLARRLGLLPENADYSRSHDVLESLVPAEWAADDLFEFQWLVKRHGQRVCVYESPACFRCPLRDLCARGVTRH